MQIDPKTETFIGTLSIASSVIANIIHEITPIVAFIAVLTGAILGCHGVFNLIKHWWHGEHHPPTDLHQF